MLKNVKIRLFLSKSKNIMGTLHKELKRLWLKLYKEDTLSKLEEFVTELEVFKTKINFSKKNKNEWYKNTVVYSLYVDLFNNDFDGLTDKLSYLENLGISCIWLLPILNSPMRDAGFDISDYRKIRADILGNKGDESFFNFINEAHKKNIKVIFDIAINHTSDQHQWFLNSASSKKNKYSDYYIWSDNDEAYSECRLLFKGMCNSNWEKHKNGKYFFHRFFEFQPDLNYKNPDVLIDMSKNLMFWADKGVDGFRADAIPYLWKEEGTNCENLDNTHVIIKFFRKVLEFINPEIILLAEACQPPKEVVKYMGNGDECHAGYHFPLMPQIFKAMSMQSSSPIKNILSPKVTPQIPENAQWFTFLRCHDELSLELVYVNEQDRKYIHENYCHKPEWDFRMGEGISARLSELFNKDTDKILQAFSIILTLTGTPIIYYGDEFGKSNDINFYSNQIQITGHNDTRNYVRGRIDWKQLEEKLTQKNSLENIIFSGLQKMIKLRNNNKTISQGKLYFENKNDELLHFSKETEGEKYIFIHNLSNKFINLDANLILNNDIIFGNIKKIDKNYSIEPFKTVWLFNHN